MTTTVLMKPNSTSSLLDNSKYTLVVGATKHAAISDSSDTSYIYKNTSASPLPKKIAFGVDISGALPNKTVNQLRAFTRVFMDGESGNLVTKFIYLGAGAATDLSAAFTKLTIATGGGGAGTGSPAYSYYGGWSKPPTGGTSVLPNHNLPSSQGGAAGVASGANIIPGAGFNGIQIEDNMPGYTSLYHNNIFEAWIEVEYVDQPTLSVTAPANPTTDTSAPSAVWTHTSGEGLTQSVYQLRVYPFDVTGMSLGHPALGTSLAGSVYDSGLIYSSSNTAQLPALVSGTYSVVVWTGEFTGTITSWSQAAFRVFVMNVAGPSAPALAGSWVVPSQSVLLTLTGHANMLSVNQSSLETDTTGWSAITNVNISRSTAQAAIGAASLSMSSAAGGDMVAATTIGTGGIPVAASTQYTAYLEGRSAVSARSRRVEISWYNAAGTFISTSQGSTAADTTSSWTAYSVTATSPGTAAFASVRSYVISTGGASEVHYTDKVALYPGALVAWSPGGPTNALDFILERSNDGGVTWQTVRHAAADIDSPIDIDWIRLANGVTQAYSNNDYEARRTYTVQYRAAGVRTDASGLTTVGPFSSINVVTVSDGNWWVKAMDTPALNYGAPCVQGNIAASKSESVGIDYPMGRTRPVFDHGDLYGWDGAYDFATNDAIAWKKLDNLISVQGTILVQSPYLDEVGAGEQKYVQWVTREHELIGPPSRPIRKASLGYLEVAAY